VLHDYRDILGIQTKRAMELQDANRPTPRSDGQHASPAMQVQPTTRDRQIPRATVRVGFWILAIVSAFGVGNLLGAIHYGTSPLSMATLSLFSAMDGVAGPGVSDPVVIHESHLAQPIREANRPSGSVAVSSNRDARPASGKETSNRKLRLRSISRLSSASAHAGERVTFVTEEAIEDACGRTVPAGAVVQGVISHAASSSIAGAGKLVIEIHSMQTGRRSLSLSALPLAAIAIPPETALTGERNLGRVSDTIARNDLAHQRKRGGLLRRTINNLNEAPSWVKGRVTRSGSTQSALGLLPEAAGKPNNQTHEAVVPKETVLEFELITLPSGGPRAIPAAEPKGLAEPKPQPQPGPAWPHSSPRTSQG
jgi:hypothetical protein